MNEPSNNEKEKVDRSAKKWIGLPKGVYRFKTLEEADEWEKKMLVLTEERLAAHHQNPASSVPIDEMKSRLRSKFRG